MAISFWGILAFHWFSLFWVFFTVHHSSCPGENQISRLRHLLEETGWKVPLLMPVYSWPYCHEPYWFYHYQHLPRDCWKVWTAPQWVIFLSKNDLALRPSFNLFFPWMFPARTLWGNTRVIQHSPCLDCTELSMVSMFLTPNSILFHQGQIQASTSPTLKRRGGWRTSIQKLKSFFSAKLRIKNTCEFFYLSTTIYTLQLIFLQLTPSNN